VGIFDESSYRSRSARFAVSLAASSHAFGAAITEIPSLLLTSVGIPTSEFPMLVLSLIVDSIAGAVDADAGQSAGTKTVWVSLAAILAVLLVVGAILLVVVHRRRTSLSPTTSETDGAIPVDVESSLEGLGDFLSGENALSHNRGFSTVKQMNDIDESLKIARSKVAGRSDLLEHDWPE
jgi:hypothetical protein